MSRERHNNKPLRQRRLQERPLRQSFLIYCEGETEVGYFTEFGTRAKVVKGGTALLKVEEAIKKNEAEIRESHQYWIVFDKDDATDKNFNNAIQLAIENQIQPAWTNQAFELWLILHFRPFSAKCHRKEYVKLLKKFIPYYLASEKSRQQGKWLYEKTKARIETAIDNARTGYNSFGEHFSAAQKESSTRIFELVIQIRENS